MAARTPKQRLDAALKKAQHVRDREWAAPLTPVEVILVAQRYRPASKADEATLTRAKEMKAAGRSGFMWFYFIRDDGGPMRKKTVEDQEVSSMNEIEDIKRRAGINEQGEEQRLAEIRALADIFARYVMGDKQQALRQLTDQLPMFTPPKDPAAYNQKYTVAYKTFLGALSKINRYIELG